MVTTQILNILIFYDLYKLLRDPFFPRRKRMPYFIITCFGWYIFSQLVLHNFMTHPWILYTVFFFLPMILPLIISVFILKFINKKGTAQKLKRDMLKRHLIYVILYEIYCCCIYHKLDINQFSPNHITRTIWGFSSILMTLN